MEERIGLLTGSEIGNYLFRSIGMALQQVVEEAVTNQVDLHMVQAILLGIQSRVWNQVVLHAAMPIREHVQGVDPMRLPAGSD